MRDPNYTEIWLDNLVHQQLPAGDTHSFATPRFLRARPPPMMPAKIDNGDQQHQSLAKLRDLPTTAVLLLLTPVLIPVGYLNYDKRMTEPYEVTKARIQQIDTDPFEHLGRALAKRYRRVRHVPYLPGVGMTATHKAFISLADEVIVVTADPEPTGQNEAATTDSMNSLKKQAKFAESVVDYFTAAKGADSDIDASLVVDLHFGSQQRKPAGLNALASVWVASKYTAVAVERAMQLVLETQE